MTVAVAVVLLAAAWAGRDSSSLSGSGLCRQFPPSPAPLSPHSLQSCLSVSGPLAALNSSLCPGPGRGYSGNYNNNNTRHWRAGHCSLLLSPQFLPRLPPTGPQHTTHNRQHSLLTRIIHPTDGFNFNVILRLDGSVLRINY